MLHIIDDDPSTKLKVIANLSLVDIYLGLDNRDKRSGAMKAGPGTFTFDKMPVDAVTSYIYWRRMSVNET